jgi:DNA-binding CsgD family transcriptional regulator
MIQQQVAPNRLTLGQEVGLREKSQLSRPLQALTYRERDVLTLAARGLSNQRIGAKLGISGRTVRCTLHHASTKLGARSRLEAVYTAVVLGYIALDEILSFDELILVFKSLSSEAFREIAKQLKQRQFDELVNLLAPFDPTMLQKAARRLKQSQDQLQLPPIASKVISEPSNITRLRRSE